MINNCSNYLEFYQHPKHTEINHNLILQAFLKLINQNYNFNFKGKRILENKYNKLNNSQKNYKVFKLKIKNLREIIIL